MRAYGRIISGPAGQTASGGAAVDRDVLTLNRSDPPAFRHLMWTFLTAAFVGERLEVLYVWCATGVVMSRSSLGAVLVTWCLWPFRCRGPWVLLLAGGLLGGGFEYVASAVGELLFHRIFWDYSYMPFHLAGRTNLLFALVWGLGAALWIDRGFPALTALTDRLPPRVERTVLRVTALLLAADMALSAAALLRMEGRRTGRPAAGPVAAALDRWYPDQVLHSRYQNLMDPR